MRRQADGLQSSIPHRRSPARWLLALCLLALAPALEAQDYVRFRFSSGAPNAQLEDILYLSIGVQLTKEGLSATRSADDAPYLLEIAYASRGNTADLTLTLSAVTSRITELGTLAVALRIDHSFDAQVGEAVARLLAQARLDRAAREEAAHRATIEGLYAENPVEAARPADGPPPAPQEAALTAPAPDERWRLGITAGLGGVALFGDITGLMHYGLGGLAAAHIVKPWSRWSLAAGLRLSSACLLNDIGVQGGPLWITTLGPDLLAGSGTVLPYRLQGSVSCGLAILSVAGGAGGLSKSAFYAELGAGLLLPLGKGFFAGLDLSYLMVFDADLLIMAAVPQLVVRKEFP